MKNDLRRLPQLKDSLSYIYIEHAIIEQNDSAIMFIQKEGRTPVPISAITVLLLGPGTSITHAAIKAISDNGAAVVWVGEKGTNFYGFGIGETRSGANLKLQAKLCTDSELHMAVVRKMYEFRFPGINCSGLTLAQIRGFEGVRVREAYKIYSKKTGVRWTGRKYRVTDYQDTDPVNRALTIANSCLYGICHSAIVALGYSPGLGFVHTGRILSFVYDVADLYKVKTTIPAAFDVAANCDISNIDREARQIARLYFKEQKILKNIAMDIKEIFDVLPSGTEQPEEMGLWNEEELPMPEGIGYASEIDIESDDFSNSVLLDLR